MANAMEVLRIGEVPDCLAHLLDVGIPRRSQQLPDLRQVQDRLPEGDDVPGARRFAHDARRQPLDVLYLPQRCRSSSMSS